MTEPRARCPCARKKTDERRRFLKLARRFIELPVEKRRVFLETLRGEGIDFSLFPIPAGVSSAERDRLSYAQQRMWFLWHLEPQSGAYNLPSAVRLNGPLDLQALERAFASLVQRHETLRTVFPRGADDSLAQAPLQRPLEVAFEDCSGLARGRAGSPPARRRSASRCSRSTCARGRCCGSA